MSEPVVGERRTAASAASLAIGLTLLAAAVVLVFVPPPAQPLVAPPPGAPLVERLFPDVPAAFVAARLLLLAFGAALVALAVGRTPLAPTPFTNAAFARDRAALPVAGLRLALALALLHLASLVALPLLGWGGETLFVLAGFLPGFVLFAAARRSAPLRLPWRRAPLLRLVLLLAAWLALRLPVAWHDPRAADTVDTWLNFGWIESTLAERHSLLLSSPQPGVSNLHLVLLGIPLLRPLGIDLGLGFLQLLQAIFVVVTALLIADLARRALGNESGQSAALVAVASFLFAPFTLSLLHMATVFALACALIVWTIWLAVRLRASGSAAALALLGSLAGIATTIPQIAPFALAAGIATAFHGWRGPRLPLAAWAIPTAGFLAFALPAIPGPGDLAAMRTAYLDVRGEWAGLQAVLLGQQSRFDPVPAKQLWSAGRPEPWDAALGTVLAPFATPRTALRLWGDVYLEPIGTALVALGLVLALLHLRRERRARVALALFAVAVLPGASSAYDRASLTRSLGIPVVAALFAAGGFEALRRRLALPGGSAALLTCTAMAVSGVVLFERVTPRLLPASHLGLALRLLERGAPAEDTLLLDDAPGTRVDWLHVGRITRHVPARPLAWRPFDGAPSLLRAPDRTEPAAGLLLWSPALEHDRSVSESVCALWPGATLYRFFDRAHLSSLLAARPAADGWRPQWPGDAFESRPCSRPTVSSRPPKGG